MKKLQKANRRLALQTNWKLGLLVILMASLMITTISAQNANAVVTIQTAQTNTTPIAARNVLLEEGFEGEQFPPSGWTMIDADGDSWSWAQNSYYPNTGFYQATSIAPDGIVDNYLITPALTMQGGLIYLEYYVNLYEQIGQSYSVLVSTTTPTVGAFTDVLITEHSPREGWVHKLIDLSFYSGQTIYIAFRHFETYESEQIYIDDVRVFEPVDNDLEALSIKGNSLPIVGEPATYTVKVQNRGINTVSGFIVSLIQGNTVLASVPGVTLGFFENHDFEIVWTPTTVGEAQIYGEIEGPEDENPENNITPILFVNVLPAGQNVVYIGDHSSTATANYPISTFHRTFITQSLYFANELPANGPITHLAYRFYGSGDFTEDVNVQFYITHTDIENHVVPVNPPLPMSEFIKVFDGTISLATEGVYDVIIPLDEPFIYEGGNILIRAFKPWTNMESQEGNRWQSTLFEDDYEKEFLYRTLWGLEEAGNSQIDPENFNFHFASGWGGIPNTTLIFDPTEKGHIQGIITQDGYPVEGVIVRIDGLQRKAVTNINGEYTLLYVSEGIVNLTASKIGYFEAQATGVIVIDDEITTVNFSLEPLPSFSVSGRIISSDTGQPLTGATVSITGYTDYPVITTDNSGEFLFPDVYGYNSYFLVVNYPTYTELRLPFEIVDSEINFGDIMIYEFPYHPRLITATLNEDNVHITWMPPYKPNPQAQWFSQANLDEPLLTDRIGVENSSDWKIAHRYSPAHLNQLGVAGEMLLDVGFIVNRWGTRFQSFHIEIYTGGSAFNPGTLVHEQYVNPKLTLDTEWTIIDLDTPVLIPTNEELWIALRVVGKGFIFFTDYGPEISMYGNLMYVQGHGDWQISDVPANWLLKASATNGNGRINMSPITSSVPSVSHLLPKETINTQEKPLFSMYNLSINDIDNIEPSIYNDDSKGNLRLVKQNITPFTPAKRVSQSNAIGLYADRALEYYNVYRTTRENTDNPEMWTLLATNITETEYTDHTIKDIEKGFPYVYIVKSIYSNDNETFAFSNRLYIYDAIDYHGDTDSQWGEYLIPISTSIFSSLSQTIYLEEDFNHRGYITDIMLDIHGFGTADPNRIVKLYMATSTRNYFQSWNHWLPYNQFTLVYEGTIPITMAGEYDVHIKLDTPYLYDGENLFFMAYTPRGDVTTESELWIQTPLWEGIRQTFAIGFFPNEVPDPAFGYPTTPRLAATTVFITNMGFIFDEYSSEGENFEIPLVTTLQGNYPNPFNPITTIAFDKEREGNVRLDIYNIRGQRVKRLVDEVFEAGSYSLDWNGTDENGRSVASGIYFYRMETEERTETKRMVLMK